MNDLVAQLLPGQTSAPDDNGAWQSHPFSVDGESGIVSTETVQFLNSLHR